MRSRKVRGQPRVAGFLALALSVFAGCADEQEIPDDAIVFGVLLPYTGANNPTGFNNERAIALATERINAHGGVHGKPVYVVPRDTGLPAKRVADDARALVEEKGATLLLGPDRSEVVSELLPMISEKSVLTIAASSTLPWYDAQVAKGFLRTVAPNTRTLASALVRSMASEKRSNVFVVTGSDPYSKAFSGALITALNTAGIKVAYTAQVDSEDPQLDAPAERAFYAADVDAVALVLFPKPGARFLGGWAQSEGRRWYLAPPLQAQEFLDNLPSGLSLEMSGVAPALPLDAAEFARVFRERWDGDEPGAEAYYYYDATILAALALEAAHHDSDAPTPREVRDRLNDVSYSEGGSPVTWRNVEKALELVRNGKPINYVGASGALDIKNGLLQAGPTHIWRVRERKFVDE